MSISTECYKLENGVMMPKCGLGTWRIRGKECEVAVTSAMRDGYLHIDTASVYRNEVEIGEALKQFGSGPLRNEDLCKEREAAGGTGFKVGNTFGVFITSKAQPAEIGRDITYEACLRTMERLGVSQLDLYLLHWCGTTEIPMEFKDNRAVRRAAWKDMERLYEEGKVRAIGVSNWMETHLEMLLEDGVKVKPMVNQIELHPLLYPRGVVDLCKKHNIYITAYSSLGSGDKALLNHPVITKIAHDLKKSPGQILLRWPLQKNMIILPCSRTPAHIKENLLLKFDIPQDAMEQIDQISTNQTQRFCWDPTVIP